MFKRKPKVLTPAQVEEIRTKDFFDCILPGTIKFMTDHYIIGDSYRCVWVIREYPPTTEEQAILAQLADRSGVTLRIYHRLVESMEQRKIVQNATRRNKLKTGSDDMNETIEAQGNLQDVVELLANLRKNKEPLLHCSVFLELKAKNLDALKELQSDIAMELTRSKISVDRLTLRQKEGFLSVLPVGSNQFGAQFERVLPASSVANLYPFNFSGKTDPQGLYIGRDKYGTNILVDFDRRAEDKTTSNILILGNSGQGKSYLLKLILTNIRESGKRVICLDPESEYEELSEALGGCYIDFLSGQYTINPLEPKAWSDGTEEMDLTAPDAFKKVTRLSQHIAFLKDFFRAYKDFNDAQIDTIEILLSKLYARFGITDSTDYSTKRPADFPIMEDFYKLCEEEFYGYDKQRKYLYTEETLQEVCLGIHSMCVGSESKYFNGHTNITDSNFLVFGVKGLMDTNKRLKDAMLFNVLSFMSNELLGKGNTAASIDELYLFLTNMTAIEYIRNAMKRVRKKDSSIILASQNKLRFGQENILGQVIAKLEYATQQYKRNNKTAMQISQKIAEINATILTLNELRSKGYLAPEVYQSQIRQMQKQLSELKDERQDQFESRILAMLQEVRKLKALLDEIEEPLDEFDEKLFTEIVVEMTINHADELTVTLLGGLKFTELI